MTSLKGSDYIETQDLSDAEIGLLLDTATDLQFDLCGIVIGTLLACVLLRTQRVTISALEGSRAFPRL